MLIAIILNVYILLVTGHIEARFLNCRHGPETIVQFDFLALAAACLSLCVCLCDAAGLEILLLLGP